MNSSLLLSFNFPFWWRVEGWCYRVLPACSGCESIFGVRGHCRAWRWKTELSKSPMMAKKKDTEVTQSRWGCRLWENRTHWELQGFVLVSNNRRERR